MIDLEKIDSESSLLISKITKRDFNMWLIKDDVRSRVMDVKSEINLRIYFIFSIFSSKLSDMRRQFLVGMRKYKHACFNYARIAVGLPKILSNREMRWHNKRMMNVEFDFNKIVKSIENCKNKMEIDSTTILISLYEKKHHKNNIVKYAASELKEKLDLQIEKLCIHQ